MKNELRTILESIVKDLESQNLNPRERPIVFMWTYPETDLKYTLIIEKYVEDPQEDFYDDVSNDSGVVH